jgi:hypothetical protein
MVSSGMLRRVALIRATQSNIPEDTIPHNHRRENLKSCVIDHLIYMNLCIYVLCRFRELDILHFDTSCI